MMVFCSKILFMQLPSSSLRLLSKKTSNIFHCSLISDYYLVAERMECSGAEEFFGHVANVDACAKACKGKSEMFAFGTNDFGTKRCQSKGCNCICETVATWERGCPLTSHNGYRVYKYESSSKPKPGKIKILGKVRSLKQKTFVSGNS